MKSIEQRENISRLKTIVEKMNRESELQSIEDCKYAIKQVILEETNTIKNTATLLGKIRQFEIMTERIKEIIK